MYWVFLILILGFKETMAGLGVGLGIYLVFREKSERKIGFLTIIIGILWGFLTSKLIIPYFSGGHFFYSPVFPSSVRLAITSFFYPWIKLKTVFFTYATFGILPIGYLPLLPAIIENFLERFVFQNDAVRWDLGFHYNAPLSPLLIMASMEFIKKYQLETKFPKILKVWAIFVIATVFILHRFILHGPLMLFSHPAFYQTTKNNKFLTDFINKIPRHGLIMTQHHFATRFTHNCVIILKDDYKKYDPDYIALDLRTGQNPANFYPLTEGATRELFEKIKKDPSYTLKKLTDNTFIFAKIPQKRDNKKGYCLK